MSLRWMLATIHLLGLGIGLGAVWARARALRGDLDLAGLRRVFYADTWWGVAAVVWIVTGLIRAFGGLEKGAAYYVHNHLFQAKMGGLILILILELAPMLGLIRWRIAAGRGGAVDTSRAHRFATISRIQAALLVLMVLAAAGMARGYGAASSVGP
jgi:putative membrane protein